MLAATSPFPDDEPDQALEDEIDVVETADDDDEEDDDPNITEEEQEGDELN